MAAFNYGWGEEPDPDPMVIDPNNPLGAGGAIGSQPGSQTDGQGAGITPTPIETPPIDPTQGAGASTPTAPAPAAPTTAPAAPTPTAPPPTSTDFSDLLNKIQTATNPQDAALQKDQLSRQLYSTLADQGHDVKWDGDNLMVDGRPYVVAGGGYTGGATFGSPTYSGGGTATVQQAAPQQGQWAPTQQGFLDWATQTYGIDPTRGAGFVNAQAGGGLEAMLARYQQETGNQANFMGGPSGDRVDFGQGVMDALTSGGQIWNPAGGGGGPTGGGGGGGDVWTTGGPTGLAPGAPGAPPAGTYTAPAPPTMQSQYDDMLRRAMDPANARELGLGDLTGGLANPMLTGADAAWRPTGGGYQAGTIGDADIPGFTYESMLADMEKGQGGSHALLDRILANPESLDKQTTDVMKGQMKDVLAEQQKQEEEDLRGFGAASGISDSGWLASQRAGSRRGRDMAVARGAQDVDIQAATTNAEDRRKAAALGLQRGEQRRAQVQTAGNAALARSAAIGDRFKLREDVKAEAGRQRISEDQVMSNFLQGKQDSLLKKYGIDLGASVDVAKLNQQSKEFREGLMEKMAALEKTLEMQQYGIETSAATSRYGTDVGAATSRYATDVGAGTSRYATDVGARLSDAQRAQLDRQFAAGLGLDYDKFNFQRDQDQWKRMQDLYGGAG